MQSRDVVLATLNHQEPGRIPIDFGATAVTGLHVSVVAMMEAVRAINGSRGGI